MRRFVTHTWLISVETASEITNLQSPLLVSCIAITMLRDRTRRESARQSEGTREKRRQRGSVGGEREKEIEEGEIERSVYAGASKKIGVQRYARVKRTWRGMEGLLILWDAKARLLILLWLHFQKDESHCDCEGGSCLSENLRQNESEPLIFPLDHDLFFEKRGKMIIPD